jgi:AraC-like DNA-binding protein
MTSPDQPAAPDTSPPAWAIAPTVPAPFLADLLGRGAARAALLRQLGLGSAARISPLQFVAALRAAVRAGDDEMFGLYARPVPPGSYDRLLRLQTYCPTVLAALEEGAGFYALFDGAPPWQAVTGSRQDEIRMTPRNPRQAGALLYTHLMLLSLWHNASWLAGETLPLRDVILPKSFRGVAAESRFLFGRAPRYGDAARLILPAGSLKAAVLRRADEAGILLQRNLLALVGPGPQGSLETRLRALLAGHQPFAALKESAAAKALGMSRQTLAKRLAARGTSFQTIREELRRDLACNLLARSDMGFAEIAERLGYSEPSAFQRAFKHWTGQPPGLYRRRGRAMAG